MDFVGAAEYTDLASSLAEMQAQLAVRFPKVNGTGPSFGDVFGAVFPGERPTSRKAGLLRLAQRLLELRETHSGEKKSKAPKPPPADSTAAPSGAVAPFSGILTSGGLKREAAQQAERQAAASAAAADGPGVSIPAPAVEEVESDVDIMDLDEGVVHPPALPPPATEAFGSVAPAPTERDVGEGKKRKEVSAADPAEPGPSGAAAAEASGPPEKKMRSPFSEGAQAAPVPAMAPAEARVANAAVPVQKGGDSSAALEPAADLSPAISPTHSLSSAHALSPAVAQVIAEMRSPKAEPEPVPDRGAAPAAGPIPAHAGLIAAMFPSGTTATGSGAAVAGSRATAAVPAAVAALPLAGSKSAPPAVAAALALPPADGEAAPPRPPPPVFAPALGRRANAREPKGAGAESVVCLQTSLRFHAGCLPPEVRESLTAPGGVCFSGEGARHVSAELALTCCRGVIPLDSSLEDGTPLAWQLIRGVSLSNPSVRPLELGWDVAA